MSPTEGGDGPLKPYVIERSTKPKEMTVTPARGHAAQAEHFLGLLEKDPGAEKKPDDDIVSGLMAVAHAILAVKEEITSHKQATGRQ